jgi:hypothetical protein
MDLKMKRKKAMNMKQAVLNTNLKRFIYVMGLLLVMTPAFTQSSKMSDKTSEEKARLMTDKQNERLQFYDDQENKMYEINLKYIKEMEKISGQPRSRQKLLKMKDLSQRKDKEVKQVLDKDQYKTYQEIKEEMRQRIRERIGSGGY